jgi:sec-independent protein translocase protein TatC
MSERTAEDEAAIEATKAPLMDHLVELRKRLIWSLIAFVLCFFICFYFAREIYSFLTLPLAHALKGQPNDHLIATGLTETFFTYAKVGAFGGLSLAFPVIAYQLWRFIAPGLYKNERGAFLPFLLASPILFIVGALFVLYVMMPSAIAALNAFNKPGTFGGLGVQLLPRVSEYLDFVTTLILAFGLTFQMPVLFALLGRVGIINAKQLRSARRFAWVGITAVAALITPPDIFSMVSLLVPLLGLYEISIVLVWLMERSRAKKDAAAAAA